MATCIPKVLNCSLFFDALEKCCLWRVRCSKLFKPLNFGMRGAVILFGKHRIAMWFNFNFVFIIIKDILQKGEIVNLSVGIWKRRK